MHAGMPCGSQDVTEENAEVLLGAKVNRGTLPASTAAVVRLRPSRSSLPSIPFYEGQLQQATEGYSKAPGTQAALETEDVALDDDNEGVW